MQPVSVPQPDQIPVGTPVKVPRTCTPRPVVEYEINGATYTRYLLSFASQFGVTDPYALQRTVPFTTNVPVSFTE